MCLSAVCFPTSSTLTRVTPHPERSIGARFHACAVCALVLCFLRVCFCRDCGPPGRKGLVCRCELGREQGTEQHIVLDILGELRLQSDPVSCHHTTMLSTVTITPPLQLCMNLFLSTSPSNCSTSLYISDTSFTCKSARIQTQTLITPADHEFYIHVVHLNSHQHACLTFIPTILLPPTFTHHFLSRLFILPVSHLYFSSHYRLPFPFSLWCWMTLIGCGLDAQEQYYCSI